MASLTSLLTRGVIGTYTHFEATEIFAQEDGSGRALNVFTLLVAEDRLDQRRKSTVFLNPSRIRLKSLPGWTFGVARYLCPIGELEPALTMMAQTGTWTASGNTLYVGTLQSVPQQFVPPDSATKTAWNKVLKNNFWNGSHVFEWSDAEKKALARFFDDSRRLQELSTRISDFVPITLAALSDRLGNLVVQLPVTVMMSTFVKLRTTGTFAVELAWLPGVTPRPLRASCELEFDGTINGYASAEINAGQTPLPIQSDFGMHRGFIWDDLNQTLMAATGPAGFINSISFNLGVTIPEPRIFSVAELDGTRKTSKVGLITGNATVIGDPRADDTGGHTRKRMYQDHIDHLLADRTFVQYKPEPAHRDAEHAKALDDIRMLISRYGRDGAWLWDPFLTARDVLETLFHCPHSGSDLRALTGADEAPSETASRGFLERLKRLFRPTHRLARKDRWIERQRAVLNSVESNWLGLSVEYRVKHGPVGFGFHDRFLIFPRVEEGALAWSLGTSVNGLGMDHHILQRVDNGQLIRDAFIELWEQLDEPAHLIWKRP